MYKNLVITYFVVLKKLSTNVFQCYLIVEQQFFFTSNFLNNFQEYSDILSRCIYCAFSHCFPQSNKQFDSNTFISAIYVVTSSWIDGIRPYPRPNQSWDMKALQPVKQVKEETVSSNLYFYIEQDYNLKKKINMNPVFIQSN